MSETNHVHTIRLPLRKFSAALPAVVLITAGLMAPATATPTAANRAGLASKNSPAIVVPATQLTLPYSWQSQDDDRSARSAKALYFGENVMTDATMMPIPISNAAYRPRMNTSETVPKLRTVVHT